MHVSNIGVNGTGEFMPDKHMLQIFKQVEEAMKNINLKDGDFLSFSDEHHRINISSYRLTMEIRFPEGIEQTGH